MATGFVKNAHRYDPYKNFKFRVIMEGRPVLGVSKVGSLKRTTEVVKHRSGGENSTDHKSPGRTTYDGITMERGITHDREFEAWANMVHPYSGDAGMDLVNYKKNLTLEVMNEKGHVAFRYFLFDCWVSEYTAMPDLDANANAVAIENIKIEMEGWERDQDTKEPDESSDVPSSI
ncbi:MAG: phage tail protein [Candidatus Loosdrechtia sp.]|uniref:phage tail protein n=1 Tax=Candidatus Loosdrechtia sp. TaxID=3101272 RepID=UPI003A79DC94|nr:MAG: phage tail protein [Candidatus Jettenia sp. AMX2]